MRAQLIDALCGWLGGLSKSRALVGDGVSTVPPIYRRAFDDSGREVWLGNAAQTLHPVAGQGLNLGLRDAFELALALRDRTVESGLSALRARRRIDRDAMVRTTDAYVSLFSNDFGPLRLARGVGLALVDTVPALRRFVARRMMFGER